MRFFTIFSLCGLAASGMASPVVASEESIAARQVGPSAALTLLTDLLASVQTYTGAINATAATISSSSSDAEKAAAIASIGSAITAITAEVSTAAVTAGTFSTIPAVVGRRGELSVRQSAPAGTIVAALQALLLELVNTIQNLVANLGLTGLLSFLNPLLAALGLLVLALIPVVDNLLALVEQLLDGILFGLGTALLGLTL